MKQYAIKARNAIQGKLSRGNKVAKKTGSLWIPVLGVAAMFLVILVGLWLSDSDTCEGKDDGDRCDDGNADTSGDVCTDGVCSGSEQQQQQGLCSEEPTFPGGTITYTNDSSGRRRATYSCTDSTMSPNPEFRTCIDGNWGGTEPSCMPRDLSSQDSSSGGGGNCSEDLDLTFTDGSVTYSATSPVEGSTATYSCNEPLIIQGSAVRTCSGGSWTGTEPSCISGNPCAQVPDGTSCDDGNAATSGDVCTSGVCGGVISPQGEGGDSSSQDSSSEGGGNCSEEPTFSDGTITYTNDSSERRRAIYSCTDPTMSPNPEFRTCIDGDWDGPEPSCDPTHIPVCGWKNRIWHNPDPSTWGENMEHDVHHFIDTHDHIPGIGGQCKGIHGDEALLPDIMCWPRNDSTYDSDLINSHNQDLVKNLIEWKRENPDRQISGDVTLTLDGICSKNIPNITEVAHNPEELSSRCTIAGGQWTPGISFSAEEANTKMGIMNGWCAPCPPNTYLNSDATECVPCGKNQYRGNNELIVNDKRIKQRGNAPSGCGNRANDAGECCVLGGVSEEDQLTQQVVNKCTLNAFNSENPDTPGSCTENTDETCIYIAPWAPHGPRDIQASININLSADVGSGGNGCSHSSDCRVQCDGCPTGYKDTGDRNIFNAMTTLDNDNLRNIMHYSPDDVVHGMPVGVSKNLKRWSCGNPAGTISDQTGGGVTKGSTQMCPAGQVRSASGECTDISNPSSKSLYRPLYYDEATECPTSGTWRTYGNEICVNCAQLKDDDDVSGSDAGDSYDPQAALNSYCIADCALLGCGGDPAATPDGGSNGFSITISGNAGPDGPSSIEVGAHDGSSSDNCGCVSGDVYCNKSEPNCA